MIRRLHVFAGVFIHAVGGRRLTGAVILVLLAAATEGVGLSLLVPLVALLGDSGTATGSIGSAVRAVLAALGLPLSLTALLTVVVGLIVVRALLVAQRDRTMARLEIDFVDARRRQLYRAIASADWLFLMRQRLSDLLEVLTSQAGQIENGTYFFLRVPALVVVAATQLLVAFDLSPVLTVTSLCWGGLLLAAFYWRFGSGYDAGRRLADTRRAFFGEISDFLQALKLAKSHGTESRHIAAFDAALARQNKQITHLAQASVTTVMVLQIAAALTLGGCIYFGADLLNVSGPALLVLVIIFTRLAPLIAEFQTAWHTVTRMLPVFDAALDLQARCELAAEPTLDAVGPVELRHEIALSGVAFRYDDAATGQVILDGLNFAIPAGSTTAIVGPTGAGKSTLVDLLLGLIAPDRGRILIDGKELTGSLRARWRRSVGYVPQDNFLFHDTVRENLIWVRPNLDEADLQRALAAAAAHEFVRALPQGLDTVIGERGVRLSGGERQRLALARALLRHPTLLVLDEATSALDPETERVVQEALERLRARCTIVIVAHRLSTVRSANRILVLDQGRVVQAGTWEELAGDQPGRFAALLAAGGEGD